MSMDTGGGQLRPEAYGIQYTLIWYAYTTIMFGIACPTYQKNVVHLLVSDVLETNVIVCHCHIKCEVSIIVKLKIHRVISSIGEVKEVRLFSRGIRTEDRGIKVKT